MAARTHYEVLGVRPDASADEIRDAYRRRAREHHPDRARTSAAGSADAMPAVNEAYRVLRDPGRRAMYDAGLRSPTASGPATTHTRWSDPGATTVEYETVPPTWDGPARVPWRGLLLCGVVASVGIVALAQFESGGVPGPDGILRAGDCVQIEPNNDAREIACTGDGDLVVVEVIPFDQSCPGGTELHRDRQGMGNACIDVP